ncbi:MAG: class I SAM-dependent methyltransferase [Desulfobacteraceae bacterium]|jgi:predicted O-methyltransferase YrrM
MKINLELVERTKGFLAPDEGERLYELAKCASQLGPCLEIGSYCGKSALYLGSACKENRAILFSIDHHCGSEEQQPGEGYFDPELFNPELYRVDTLGHFRKTIEQADLVETVVPIVSTSEVVARMWSTPLSLVFIDGGHAYETVFKDYTCWATHVITGGYLLLHDIFSDPADGGQAPFHVYQLALESGLFQPLPMCQTLGILQRI